eukprot:gnl/TRDRNA2_/TRDRNA2_35795_c0_seq1.p1 gnl/TRDRNA2_/TRDRNA2_35795_c0~~gnl/TRDRNA2_/TRDRNA2_35795_c0_seq1.p1  ORF type:complete len:421 (-),score=109.05 gnl/TRDRNA2_/TRDRNA2_35795_c0_seq1:121-1299(-)
MAAAAPKMGGFSFGFAKKAEPKKVVEALAATTRKQEVREEIKDLQDGEINLEAPRPGQGPLVIPCKNPLAEHVANRPKPKAKPQESISDEQRLKAQDDLPAGLIAQNISKLSEEDAETVKELLKDAQKTGDDEDDAVQVAPIAMKDRGSAPILSGRRDKNKEPEATRDMYDNVPVESMGEALLRGMGYDPKKHVTKPVWRDKPRDNLLGLGAKALLPHEKGGQLPGKRKPAAAEKAAAPAQAAPSAPAEQPPPEKRQRVENDDVAEVSEKSKGKDVWPSRGLVVKVVGQEKSLRECYGKEAVVLSVDEAAGLCRIKVRLGEKSQVFPDIRMEALETRVSRDCTEVRIVRGPHKGTVAALVKRDTQRNVAVVRMKKGGDETEMALDDVCQFMG